MISVMNEYVEQLMSNPLAIFAFFSSCAVLFESSRVVDYFAFKKNNRYTSIKVLPPSIIDEFDENKVAKQYRDEVVRFYEILKNNFSEEVLNAFNNNINSASIKREFLEKHAGEYRSTNDIAINYQVHPVVLVKLHVIPVNREEYLTFNLMSLLFQQIFQGGLIS